MQPRIQYARTSDGVNIAHWVQGEGYPMIQSTGAPFNHVQLELSQPNYRNWYDEYKRRFRHIRYDARGSGMSDRGTSDVSIDAQALDIEAVADKLGLERYALLVTQASTLPAIKLAIKHPERITHLVLIDGYTNGREYFNLPQTKAFRAMMEADWEMFTETLASVLFGWEAGDAARQMARFLRECVDQKNCLSYFDAVASADVTDLLDQVTQPTLICHHKPIAFPTIDDARRLAAGIRDSHLLLLEGTWQDTKGDIEASMNAIESFFGDLVRKSPLPAVSEAQADVHTILFTDIEGSTALTDRLGDAKARELFREHERITREVLASHGGTEVKTMGDGFMASFGSASRAVECAVALQRAFAERSGDEEIRVRIGLNAGEPIAEDEDLFGTAVIVAARIAAQAGGGEILVADVVRQLVAGKGFLFNDRGETELRGLEDPVRVYEVGWRDG